LKGFVFDLDDTLIYTSCVYEKAKQEFAQILISEGISLNKASILHCLREMDWRLRETMDVHKNRLLFSMTMTYQILMRKSRLSLRSSALEDFQGIMDSVHQHRYRLVRGARKLLETVRNQGHPMILYTRGDQQIQENKIHQTKIATFFQKIYITKRKSPSHLQQILDEMNFDPIQSWMIGDEILTDVNHALTCGMNVMRVWGYHNYEPAELPVSPKIINVQFLNHLMPHFSLLQKEAMSI